MRNPRLTPRGIMAEPAAAQTAASPACPWIARGQCSFAWHGLSRCTTAAASVRHHSGRCTNLRAKLQGAPAFCGEAVSGAPGMAGMGSNHFTPQAFVRSWPYGHDSARTGRQCDSGFPPICHNATQRLTPSPSSRIKGFLVQRRITWRVSIGHQNRKPRTGRAGA